MIPPSNAGGRDAFRPRNPAALPDLWAGGYPSLRGAGGSSYSTFSSSTASRGLLWIAVLVVASGFFSAKLKALTSTDFEFGSEEVELATGLIERIVSRGLAYLVLGGFGLWALTRKDDTKPLPSGLVCALLVGFNAWCALSILWSDDRSNSIMRCVQMSCVLMAALGIGRLLTARELCQVVVYVLVGYVGIGFLMELGSGVFRPWVNGYRFAGGVHPNLQSQYCAILSVAAVAMIGQPGWPRARSIWILAFAVPLLVLTGSRTSFGGLLVGLLAYWSLRLPFNTKMTLALAGGFLLSAGVVFSLFFLPDIQESLQDMMLMGRERGTESLTGRVPLWAELSTYVQGRPLTGYGYGGFWHNARKEELFDRIMWIPPSAHNAYIDAMLNVGLIGAFLLIGAGIVGWIKTWKAFIATHDSAYAFFIGVYAILLTGSYTESLMVYPAFAEFICAAGMAQVATLPALHDSYTR